MFNSKNEKVTGDDVINNLIASYYEIEPYTGESDIIHELKRALNGEDSFGFGEHAITVSLQEGQYLAKLAKKYAKDCKWSKGDFSRAVNSVNSRAITLSDEIFPLAGPTEYVYQLRTSKEGRARVRVLTLVTINAARLAHLSKNTTLSEASLLYGFFESLRLMKLNWVTREMNPPSDT